MVNQVFTNSGLPIHVRMRPPNSGFPNSGFPYRDGDWSQRVPITVADNGCQQRVPTMGTDNGYHQRVPTMGGMEKIMYAFFLSLFGLFIWEMCLNNRFKSSGESF